mmetsp:Transcript_100599/g.288281  ORF Transcript_100599/g.288281 Transcript_100599/m.288281 type:complete len:285 (-) Transcript_100599:84-938(-)
MDEDPMAYLNQKRAEMAAMSEMAVVAEQQIALANNVASRMQQIDRLLEERPDDESKPGGEPSGIEGDAEVEYWKRKIEELSGPASSSASAPLSEARPALAPREFRADENKSERSNYSSSSRAKPHASPSAYASAPSYAEAKDSRASYNSTSSSSRSREPPMAAAAKRSAGESSGARMAPSAKFEEPLDGDAEVEYWKRKIAELSQPISVSAGQSGGIPAVSYTTNSSPIGLGGGIGIGGGLAVRRRGPQEDLASQPLSWEGSQSYADENPDAKEGGEDEGKQSK